MKKQYVRFENLPVKAYFFQNGNLWQKQSTRTARVDEYGRWFYFGKKEFCVVGEYSDVSYLYQSKMEH